MHQLLSLVKSLLLIDSGKIFSLLHGKILKLSYILLLHFSLQ